MQNLASAWKMPPVIAAGKICDTRISAGKRWRVWTAAILLMGICAVATAWFPLLSINSLASENYNEGWNAYRQWMALQGQPLYGGHPALWTTNYPFLSFHIIGLLGATKAKLVLAGRIVCFISFIVTSVLAVFIIRAITASWAGAIYAGICLYAWLACFFAAGRAADDPEMLSLAFTSLGLLAYVKAPSSNFSLSFSAIAFAISLFTKHDLIAIPFSIGIHLLVTRNWRGFSVFSMAGIVAACVLLAVTFYLDGPYFFSDLLQPRAYSLQNAMQETLHYLLHFLIPMIIGVTVLLSERDFPFRSLVFILLIVTNLAAIGFSGGDGVASNIFYPAVIADLLACVIGICQLERIVGRGISFRIALTIATLAGASMVPAQIHNDIIAESHLPIAANTAQQAIAILQSTNGPAICEDLLLCYDAGKPMDYDPYYVNDQILIGRLQERNILNTLASHHYAAIQINGELASALRPRRNDGRFTKAILHAFQTQYQPVMANNNYSVFVPRLTKFPETGGYAGVKKPARRG